MRTPRVSGEEIAPRREPLKVKMGAAIGGLAGAALWMVILIFNAPDSWLHFILRSFQALLFIAPSIILGAGLAGLYEWNWWRGALRGVGLLLFAWGFLGFMSQAVGDPYGHSSSLPSLEFPLSRVDGIAIDRQDRIYLGLQFHKRIQVYDARGRFVKGWPVSDSGALYPRINNRHQLEVFCPKNDVVHVFTLDGTPYSTRELDLSDSNGWWEKTDTSRTVGPDGSIYKIRWRFLFCQVEKTTPTGITATLISGPWYEWLWIGGFSAWLICMIGLLLMFPSEWPRLQAMRKRSNDGKRDGSN